ncbi:MAG: hypothetical protein JW841_12735 [Deltaproteobacteria bacterium]|nr:hypothetical protein [Deltaproteobacteria bacterium]
MQTKLCRLFWFIPFTCIACGYTDSGSGTRTLLVQARAQYAVSGGNQTNVTVSVADRDGTEITDATVEITDGKNGQRYSIPHQNNGLYYINIENYRRRLRLHVRSGDNELSAKLEGPGPHVIDYPKAGAIRRSRLGNKFKVEWSTEDGIRADEVEISLRHGPEVNSKDDSGFNDDISMSQLTETGDYRLNLTRLNRINLGGGVDNSTFTISYSVNTEFAIIE